MINSRIVGNSEVIQKRASEKLAGLVTRSRLGGNAVLSNADSAQSSAKRVSG